MTGVENDWGWKWLGLKVTGVEMTGVESDWGWKWLGFKVTGAQISVLLFVAYVLQD